MNFARRIFRNTFKNVFRMKYLTYTMVTLNFNNKFYNFYESEDFEYEDRIQIINTNNSNIFVKVVPSNLKSLFGDFTYILGYNRDHVPINKDSDFMCVPGGLHYTTVDKIFEHFNKGNTILILKSKSETYMQYAHFKSREIYEILTLEEFINMKTVSEIKKECVLKRIRKIYDFVLDYYIFEHKQQLHIGSFKNNNVRL